MITQNINKTTSFLPLLFLGSGIGASIVPLPYLIPIIPKILSNFSITNPYITQLFIIYSGIFTVSLLSIPILAITIVIQNRKIKLSAISNNVAREDLNSPVEQQASKLVPHSESQRNTAPKTSTQPSLGNSPTAVTSHPPTHRIPPPPPLQSTLATPQQLISTSTKAATGSGQNNGNHASGGAVRQDSGSAAGSHSSSKPHVHFTQDMLGNAKSALRTVSKSSTALVTPRAPHTSTSQSHQSAGADEESKKVIVSPSVGSNQDLMNEVKGVTRATQLNILIPSPQKPTTQKLLLAALEVARQSKSDDDADETIRKVQTEIETLQTEIETLQTEIETLQTKEDTPTEINEHMNIITAKIKTTQSKIGKINDRIEQMDVQQTHHHDDNDWTSEDEEEQQDKLTAEEKSAAEEKQKQIEEKQKQIEEKLGIQQPKQPNRIPSNVSSSSGVSSGGSSDNATNADEFKSVDVSIKSYEQMPRTEIITEKSVESPGTNVAAMVAKFDKNWFNQK